MYLGLLKFNIHLYIAVSKKKTFQWLEAHFWTGDKEEGRCLGMSSQEERQRGTPETMWRNFHVL